MTQMSTVTLHPETIEFAGLLAVEYALMSPAVDNDDYEAWYRAKWHAIATGEVTTRHAWDGGIGAEATALYVEAELRRSFADDQPWLATVLGWLQSWLADERQRGSEP